MRYAGLIENDFTNGEGVSVTVFLQGCPHHCLGCHNSETWDFNGGIEINKEDLINKILTAIPKNGFNRNLSISGGEPLCSENIEFVKELLSVVKEKYPTIKIFCWSGYEYKDLYNTTNKNLMYILNTIDVLVTGPFIKSLRDITLPLRGSRNQEIWRRDDGGILVLNK